MSRPDEPGRSLAVAFAVGFWLLVPFPFWLLGWGFAGTPVWLPDTWDLLSVGWGAAFYGPLLFIAFVLGKHVANFLSRRKDQNA